MSPGVFIELMGWVLGLVLLGMVIWDRVGALKLSRESCVVAIAGSQAVLEVVGRGASEECGRWLEQSAGHALTSRREGLPAACKMRKGSLTIVVKDAGPGGAVGKYLCRQLEAP